MTCIGDCDGSSEVTVNELLILVNIALGSAPATACTTGDVNGDGQITINEILAAVNNTLDGCPTKFRETIAKKRMAFCIEPRQAHDNTWPT
jgi:hypothetical protein